MDVRERVSEQGQGTETEPLVMVLRKPPEAASFQSSRERSKYLFLAVYSKQVSYRKQIARQHLYGSNGINGIGSQKLSAAATYPRVQESYVPSPALVSLENLVDEGQMARARDSRKFWERCGSAAFDWGVTTPIQPF